MSKDYNKSVWSSKDARQLARTLAKISEPKEVEKFLADLMTAKELEEISSRLKAAALLDQGVTYTEIVKSTGLSSRTVARISDWIKNGNQGYELALKLLGSHHHLRPDRAG